LWSEVAADKKKRETCERGVRRHWRLLCFSHDQVFGTYQGTERNLCDTRQRLISKCAPKSVLSSALISIFQRLQAPGDGKICNLMCFNVSQCSTGTLAPSANCATRASGLRQNAPSAACGFLPIKAEKHTFFHALRETGLWWGALKLRSVPEVPRHRAQIVRHAPVACATKHARVCVVFCILRQKNTHFSTRFVKQVSGGGHSGCARCA